MASFEHVLLAGKATAKLRTLSERRACYGQHHRCHYRRYRKHQNDAPYRAAAPYYLLLRHYLSPFVCRPSLSLTPPYSSPVNNPLSNRPLGIRRLCILVLIPKKGFSRLGSTRRCVVSIHELLKRDNFRYVRFSETRLPVLRVLGNPHRPGPIDPGSKGATPAQ